MNNNVQNIKIAGLGGMGVLSASWVLAEAVFRSGFDVKKAEVHGMSQRGGSVASDIRFGPKVLSPMIPPDTPEALRQIRDIAFSGNGEPTSSPQFQLAVEIARRQRDAHGLQIPLVLITNGSLMLRPEVQAGVKALAEAGGVVWFKVDRLLPESMKRMIRLVSAPPERLRRN